MKRLSAIAVCSLALLTAGCAGEPEVIEVTTTVTDSPTTSSSSTTTSSTTSEEPTTESAEPAPVAEPAAPYVVECLAGTPGPALWSDGEVRHSEDCFYQNGGPAYLEAERNAGLQPGGAAVNGYGYGENGNPNRSSGEIQAEWGCQQGYITDPAICSNF